MKSLKLIIAVISISLLSTFSTQAVEKNPSEVNKNLRTKIVAILGTKIPLEIKKESSVHISFVVNSKNELVVLSVNTKNDAITTYIKSKLNYKRLAVKGTKRGEIYSLSLKIKVI